MDKRTGAAPKVVDGVEFTCWHTGINRYEWRSTVGTLCHVHQTTQWHAIQPGGELIKSANTGRGKRFEVFETAARALISAVRK